MGDLMARKPAESQMKEHEKTYAAFIRLTKLSIVSLAVTMISLYCFLFTDQIVLGWVILLIVMPVSVIYAARKDSSS